MNRRQVLLVVVCGGLLIKVVIGAILPITDPTEGRYAQIAREMVDSGDWVTPMVWSRGERVPYLGKPPLFFWSVALSIGILGPTEFAVRLPATIATVLLLALMFDVLKRTYGRSVAETAVVMTATTGLVFLLSSSAIVDLHLMLFVAGAFFANLAFVHADTDGARRRWSLLMFALLAGGFLTKGPVALVLFCLPVGVWAAVRGEWKTLGGHSWGLGLALFSLVVGPWFVLAEIRNPGFLQYFFINENLLRFLSDGYGDRYGTGHVFPRGSAIGMFAVGALPWVPVAVWLLVKRRLALVRSTLRDEGSSLFFIGFICIVLFWSLARQLLGTYLLPAVPLFAAWLACEVCRGEATFRQLERTAIAATFGWGLVILVAVPFLAARSTRGVLGESLRVIAARPGTTRIVFAGHTPHSALFYAEELIAQHPWQSPAEMVSRLKFQGDPSLLIIRERDWHHLPHDDLVSVQTLAEVPGWRVLGLPGMNRVVFNRPIRIDSTLYSDPPRDLIRN